MKALVLLAAATALLGGLATGADAKSKHHHHRSYAPYYVVVEEEPVYVAPRKLTRVRETHDDIRANAADPSGNYAGYPSWARAALGNQGRRR